VKETEETIIFENSKKKKISHSSKPLREEHAEGKEFPDSHLPDSIRNLPEEDRNLYKNLRAKSNDLYRLKKFQ